MVRGRAQGHSALCPYKMHIAPTLTSEFGFKLHVLLKAMLRTPQPFSGGGAEADLCDGPYFMIGGHSHGAAL